MMKIIVIFLITCFIIIFRCTKSYSDPFGTLPKEATSNCGPEERKNFDVLINSKNDFVNFLKNNEISSWVQLSNFKSETTDEVDWNKVIKATKVEKIKNRSVYILEFNPNPEECAGFTLKMTNDGHTSVYGCCGI